jgi:hypothetical protein
MCAVFAHARGNRPSAETGACALGRWIDDESAKASDGCGKRQLDDRLHILQHFRVIVTEVDMK